MQTFARAIRHGRFVVSGRRQRGAVVQGMIESEDLAIEGFERIVGGIALAAARAAAQQQGHNNRGAIRMRLQIKASHHPEAGRYRESPSRVQRSFAQKVGEDRRR